MARYRVLKRSFMNGSLREEGDVIDFDGEAGKNLLLLEPEKPEARPTKAATTSK